MLAKKNRLNISKEENSSIFSRVNSRILSSDFFLVYLRENDYGLLSSCVVSQSVLKKAAKRNHYRRILYLLLEESLSKNLISLEDKLDLVFLLKKNFSQDKEELSKDFLKLIKKIKNEK